MKLRTRWLLFRFRWSLWLIWTPWQNWWPWRIVRGWKNRHLKARIADFGALPKNWSNVPPDQIGIAHVFEDRWPWN